MGLEGIRPGSPHYSLPELLHRVRVWGSRSVRAQLPCSGSVMPTFQRKSKDAQKHNIPFLLPLVQNIKIFQDIRVSFILKGFF